MDLSKINLNSISKHQTPFLVCDLDIVRNNYRKIKKNIPDADIFYAIKANDNKKIVKTLIEEGSSFDIASEGELRQLKNLGVPPDKIGCFNPIKPTSFIKSLKEYGVKMMAFDSVQEMDKIAENAPGSELILRLQVDNEGSDWPLTKKFGVQATEAIDLIKYGRKKGLSVTGLTFHVGSQCLNRENWANALYICEEIVDEAKKLGCEISMISLGGGMPIKHTKPIPTLKEIGDIVNPILKDKFFSQNKNLRIIVEPGRGLVGDSAIMVTSVIGLAKRGQENWVYLDVGVFNGLMETIENFMYEIKTSKKAKKRLSTIAGPSCDSVDVMFKGIPFPEVNIGDKIYIMNTGAYTTVYGSRFNAFEVPKIYFI